MFHREALTSSIEALRANKFRAFLTALGLVIGNASVILVVTISLTSRDYILDQIQRIGSNIIYAQYEGGKYVVPPRSPTPTTSRRPMSTPCAINLARASSPRPAS